MAFQGTNSFTLRRARVGFKGFATDNVAFRFQYDASNEVPGLSNAQKLLDAWVSFKHFDDSIGTAYSTSLDSVTLDTKFQPNGVDLDNEWFSVFADVQAHHWWLWASWAQFKSDAKGGLAVNTQGDSTGTLNSNALTLGLSRAYLLNSEDMGCAWALQYQHVNNEHPSRTAFFRPLTGKSTDEIARGMNQGSVYQTLFTWQFDENLRLINELAYYDPTDGRFSYPSFISQLQLTF